MRLRKMMVASMLAVSLTIGEIAPIATVFAAPVESTEELGQYKLSITMRIMEIERNLQNNLNNQVGLLNDSRYLVEYMMYYQHAYRNSSTLGFTKNELDYYAKRLIQYMDIFNEHYNVESTLFVKLQLKCGTVSDPLDTRITKLMSYAKTNIYTEVPKYYKSILESLQKNLPTGVDEQEAFLADNTQLLSELYKGLMVYQDVPVTLTNITPLDDEEDSRKPYSYNGSGDNKKLNDKISKIIKAHLTLIQYGKRASLKVTVDDLEIDLSESAIEQFTNIEYKNNSYDFPDDMLLTPAYCAILAASSVYTPLVSYAGSSEFTNALSSLCTSDELRNNMLQAYTDVKDFRKPLYRREVASDGSVTGPAQLITIQDFIDDIENGSAGALVTVQGDFHYNTEAASWIYSQNDLTYSYRLGTTVEEDVETTESTTEEESTTDTSRKFNIFEQHVVKADNTYVVDVSSVTQMVNTIKNVIFIGDSRVDGLYAAFLNKGATNESLATNNVHFISKTAEGYKWFNDTALAEVDKILENNPDTSFTVIINLGINDLGNVSKYIKKVNELSAGSWKTANIVYQSVGAVSESKAKENDYDIKNEQIVTFNKKLQEKLNQSVNYVDITTQMLNSEQTDLAAGYTTKDGVHYTEITYLNLCKDTIIKCMDTNYNNGSNDDSATTEETSEEETSETPEKEVNEEQSELKNAIYAYDTITDETYLTQPVLFYGTKYQRAVDNTTTAILQNIFKDSTVLNEIKDKGSRYLYMNMFGDIVTDDNLIILPGFANPIIYNNQTAYNPYSVAFMNSYPSILNRGLHFQVASEPEIGKYVLLSSNNSEDISNSTMNWALIDSDKTISMSNLHSSLQLTDSFYTNGTEENVIISGQRMVFGNLAQYLTSQAYSYNVVLQSNKPVVNETFIFPYNVKEDTEFIIAKTIVQNAYEYLCYDREKNIKGNNCSLNDNYIAHNIIISGFLGNKNPKSYSEDKLLEYKQYLQSKTERLKQQIIELSSDWISGVSNVEGALGLDSSYENKILGNFLQITRDNFILILICVLLVMLIAFLKYHRDLLEIAFLSLATAGILVLFVYVLPVYLPMGYNFLVDRTSSTIAYRVLGMNMEKNASKNYAFLEIDDEGNYRYNSSSLTLYKVDPLKLDAFYDNLSVDMRDVIAGKTEIINQEAGIFIEGDSIKVNTDILFENLPITGHYTSVNGAYCWQLKSNKTVSNNVDYYIPFYYVTDNFINKLNQLAQVYDLTRSTTTYSTGVVKDNYLVYSYVNSPVFLTPGEYDINVQENAEEFMTDYASFVEQNADLEAILTTVFGNNTDWLGIAPIFVELSEQDKQTLWAQTMQDNGYYDEDWNPDKDKINDLIMYVNRHTKDFVFDMTESIGKLSDETMIKLISLRATIAFTQEVSQFKHWLYPFSLDYAELSMGEVLNSIFVDDYNKYVTSDMEIAEYIGTRYNWFVLVIFDLLVLVMFIVINIVNVMVPVLYILLLCILFIRFLLLGDLKIPVKGYLKTSFILFISYTIFNLTFWVVSELESGIWGILVALLVSFLVLYVIVEVILSVAFNLLDFGDRELSAKLVAIGDNLKVGDLFNNIKLQNINFGHKEADTYRYIEDTNERKQRRSRYNMNASVDSIYDDRRFF